jgi:predicted dehydrogenase
LKEGEEMTRKVHLGLIGTGIAMRKLHYPALRKLSDFFDVVAVSSGHVENAQKFAAEFDSNIRVFNDYHHMMVSGLVDAVDIAVPTQFNFEIIRDAMRNGVHVICEKPIAENVKTAKDLLRLTRGYDHVFMIAESQRYDPQLDQINDLIRIGKIGKPVMFDWNVIVNFSEDNEYVNTPWRMAPKHIGGFLSDAGVHHMAILRAIFGEIAEVSGFVNKVNEHIGGEDTMVMNMLFKNGVMGSYSVSYGLRTPAHKSLKIYGTRGKMRATPREIEVIKENDEIEKYEAPMVNLFEEEFKEFYNAIVNGEEVKLGTPESALRDLAAIEAGIQSSRIGCVVKMDELLE